jgi:competence protein ComEA
MPLNLPLSKLKKNFNHPQAGQIWRISTSAAFFVLGVISFVWGSQQLLEQTSVPECVYQTDELRFNHPASPSAHLRVEIAGAVNQPGIYAVAATDRLADLIRQAQGLHPKADRHYITRQLNLAQRLQDEAKIYIPYKTEQELEERLAAYCQNVQMSTPTPDTQKTNDSLSAKPTPTSAAAANTSSQNFLDPQPTTGPNQNQQNQSCININSASLEELQQLPNIGPATAENIISARQNGPFLTKDDLLEVKNIGPATLEKIKDLICI